MTAAAMIIIIMISGMRVRPIGMTMIITVKGVGMNSEYRWQVDLQLSRLDDRLGADHGRVGWPGAAFPGLRADGG
jgi:hypothetical protein